MKVHELKELLDASNPDLDVWVGYDGNWAHTEDPDVGEVLADVFYDSRDDHKTRVFAIFA